MTMHLLKDNYTWLFSGVLVTVIGSILAMFRAAIWTWIVKRWGKPTCGLSVNYARLFGAFQVPALFEINNSEWRPADSRYDFSLLNFEKTKNWWNSSQFAKALLIGEPLWTPIQTEFRKVLDNPHGLAVSNSEISNLLLGTNLAKMRQLFDDYLMIANDYETDSARERPKMPIVRAAIEKLLEQTGYTFIVMQIQTYRRDIDFLVIRYKIEENGGSALNFRLRRTSELQEMIVANPAVGSDYMLLLNVYTKDKNGFPSTYVSPNIVPFEIVLKFSEGRSYKMRVRKPLMEKAAKVLVPIGWYSQ